MSERGSIGRRILLAGSLAAPLASWAQRTPLFHSDDHRVAANGYDVVSYFSSDPARGIPGIEVDYQGFTWFFETQANADLFQVNPERFAPQFGGYCAYGVSRGYLIGTDPLAWSVVGDKLYLNYNQTIRVRWLKDTRSYIALAEKHWPRLINA